MYISRDQISAFIEANTHISRPRPLCMREFELARRMPPEAHLDAVGDATAVRPDPRFMRVEGDPDVPCPVTRLGAGRLVVV